MPVGIYSAPLKQIACELFHSSMSDDSNYDLTWRVLSSPKTTVNLLLSSYLLAHHKMFISGY